MSIAKLHPRWKRSPREFLLLLEAGAFLIAARFALRTLRTSQIVAWVRRPLPVAGALLEECHLRQFQWAVTAFSRNAPIRLVCFPQALAMYAMLRRRGLTSEILYGAARLEDGSLAAHAWLRSEGRIWIGGEVAADFSVLDIWKPSSHPRQDHRFEAN